MNKFKLIISIGMMSVIINAQAADLKSGKIKHDEKCTACHIAQFGKDGSGIYTRKDRKMKSLSMLAQRVSACNANTKSGFSADQVKDVTEYLNSTYYQFKK